MKESAPLPLGAKVVTEPVDKLIEARRRMNERLAKVREGQSTVKAAAVKAAVKPEEPKQRGPGFDRPHTLASTGVKVISDNHLPLWKVTLPKVNFSNPSFGFQFHNSVAFRRCKQTDINIVLRTWPGTRVQNVDVTVKELKDMAKAQFEAHKAEFAPQIPPEVLVDDRELTVTHPWLNSDATWRGLPEEKVVVPEEKPLEPA